jgi:hypothetical protein
MSQSTATEHPADPFQLLPKAIYRAIVADLYADIAPPTLTDPELIAERVHAAIGEIASMCPVNAEEARVAARVATAAINRIAARDRSCSLSGHWRLDIGTGPRYNSQLCKKPNYSRLRKHPLFVSIWTRQT